MTSMPASRRAAATTLAPRSCPSSPGLATSTRIGRMNQLKSEEHGLAICAKHRLERGTDLVERAVPARAFQDVGEEILRPLRRHTKALQSCLTRCVVSPRTQLSHPLPLRSIDLRADLQRWNAQLGFVGDEFIDTDYHAAMLLDLPLLSGGGLRDLALEPASLESIHDATDAVDLHKQLLRLALELVRKRLDIV